MTDDRTQQGEGLGGGGEDASLPRRGRRVLVTGARGFIGRHLVTELLKNGWEVTALTRSAVLPTSAASPGLRFVQGDLTDPLAVERLAEGADAVCHLAAWIPADLEDATAAGACLEANALVALRVAEAAARSGARLVFFSSGQVYRQSDQPLSEDSPTYPASRATYYLASKLAGELFVEHCRLLRGLEALTLRIGSCYGAGMPERSVVARFMTAAQAGRPLEVWDGGASRSDFVFVGDVVGLTLAALQGGAPGVYNAGSGRAESVLELARAIGTVFEDRRIEVVVRPPPPHGPPPAGFSPLSTGKASAAWGYRPRSLLEGLREYRRQLETERAHRGIQ